MEQSQSVCESSLRQRDEAQREADRLRTNYREVERTLATRDRAHRHRVKGLEEQVEMPGQRSSKSTDWLHFHAQFKSDSAPLMPSD